MQKTSKFQTLFNKILNAEEKVTLRLHNKTERGVIEIASGKKILLYNLVGDCTIYIKNGFHYLFKRA